MDNYGVVSSYKKDKSQSILYDILNIFIIRQKLSFIVYKLLTTVLKFPQTNMIFSNILNDQFGAF